MRWIKYSDKPPQDMEECLVSFEILPGERGCGLAYSLATYSRKRFLSWERNVTIENVTHWMSLPEGPEDD